MILREQGTHLNNNSFQTKSQNNTGQNQPITKTNTRTTTVEHLQILGQLAKNSTYSTVHTQTQT